MFSVSIAKSPKDFEIAAALCRELADWDIAMAATHGVDPQLVTDLYHGETAASLARRYAQSGTGMLLASWDGRPAGCLAFSVFDNTADELHKFYVAPDFRQRGIGGAMMRAVIHAVETRRKSTLLAHTTIYMTDAISIYRACGFDFCPPFREVPKAVGHTEIFLRRDVPSG
jgi:GNAT superfamily N-acetyltransferase